MCGIAGIVGVFGPADAIAAVARMTAALARRGPDAEGLSAHDGAVLGHRRLAIFDLSEAGNQPMRSADGRSIVVFNGAIYNFQALRSELIKLGFSFRSASDTEVLLHGYRAWGIERMVQRLRGMFAFGLWDEQERKLFLVRDRLGVKPLLYARADGTIAFASTARALKCAGYGGAMDRAAVLDCLRWGFVAEDHCIYKGIEKLPPATIMEWCSGKTRQYCYWKRPLPDHASPLSFRAAVEETERRFAEAVAIRLNADVPVGILLSGGIDSSLIAWMVSRLGGDLTAYTVGVPGDHSDETAAAVQSARRLKIRHRVVTMSAHEALDVDELIAAYDEPFACSSALAMLRVARAVASSAKVLLTGDGGDDLFLGYPRHRHLWLAEKTARNLPQFLAGAWNRWGGHLPRVGALRRGGAFMDYATGGLQAFLRASLGASASEAHHFLGPRLVRAAISAPPPVSLEDGGMLETFIDFEHRTRFIGEYLRKIDGATMHHGLEARSPFLDQELWELGSALPVSLRLRGGRLKAVLRELVRSRIGARVALRKKRGFRIPVQRWLAGRLLRSVEQTMHDSLAAQEGWIDRDSVLSALGHPAPGSGASEMLWRIFVLERWMRYEKERQSEQYSTSRPGAHAEKVVA
jgi:asparagine synthase (glutamine-hydrolysing)